MKKIEQSIGRQNKKWNEIIAPLGYENLGESQYYDLVFFFHLK